MFATVSIKKNSCPIGYKNKDQVISCGIGRRPSTGRAPDPGLKLEEIANGGLKQQASSCKHQASSTKHQAFEPTCSIAKRQASQPE
jgi:hypothetical protein